MSVFRAALIAATLVCFAAAPAWSQDGRRGVPARGGDNIEARAGNAAADARVREFCEAFYPPEGKERDRRAKYQDWIKDLLCRYIIADFTKSDARRGYVERVLGALREHGAGAWNLPNRAPVRHIVTLDPAYLYKRDKDTSPWVKEIKTAAIQRSLRDPAAATVGVHQSLFATPPAKDVEEANFRIPKAEGLIQRILAMAVVADMIAVNARKITENQSGGRIKAALAEFKRLVLTVAIIPNLGGAGIDARPQGAKGGGGSAPDDYRPPGEEVGRNVLAREPAERDKPIKIDKIKAGDAIGLTRSISGISLKLKTAKHFRKNLESVEPRWKFKRSFVLRSVVRTFIVIETFYGLPKGKKALRVLSADGKTNCTWAIREHENRHVADVWKAWREKLVLAVERDLKERSFKELKEARVRTFAHTENKKFAGRRMRVTYLDIHGAFVFPSQSLAKLARKAIHETYKKDQHKKLRKAFSKEKDALADKYHAMEQVGLDDDCKPVRDPAKARTPFGNLGKDEAKKPSEAKLRQM